MNFIATTSQAVSKKSSKNVYGADVSIIREKMTRKGGRIEVTHPREMNIFEFDDSSERRDQLRNARYLAQTLLDKGMARFVVDEIANTRHDKAAPVVKDGYVVAEQISNMFEVDSWIRDRVTGECFQIKETGDQIVYCNSKVNGRINKDAFWTRFASTVAPL